MYKGAVEDSQRKCCLKCVMKDESVFSQEKTFTEEMLQDLQKHGNVRDLGLWGNCR